jgi:hypothetical protein
MATEEAETHQKAVVVLEGSADRQDSIDHHAGKHEPRRMCRFCGRAESLSGWPVAAEGTGEVGILQRAAWIGPAVD